MARRVASGWPPFGPRDFASITWHQTRKDPCCLAKPPACATINHDGVRCQDMPAALRGQRRKASRFESGPGHPVIVAHIVEGSIRNPVRPACTSAGRCPFNEVGKVIDHPPHTVQPGTRIAGPELPETPSRSMATPCYGPSRDAMDSVAKRIELGRQSGLRVTPQPCGEHVDPTGLLSD